MWDEGLNGRFCSECFDHVVDAEELLASQGLAVPGPEMKQEDEKLLMIIRMSGKTVYFPAAPRRETNLIRRSCRVRSVHGCILVSRKKSS